MNISSNIKKWLLSAIFTAIFLFLLKFIYDPESWVSIYLNIIAHGGLAAIVILVTFIISSEENVISWIETSDKERILSISVMISLTIAVLLLLYAAAESFMSDSHLSNKNHLLITGTLFAILSLFIFLKKETDAARERELTLPNYVISASNMYQNEEYTRVVTTVVKWLCAGKGKKELGEALRNIKAQQVIFIGHIDNTENLPGVIWRFNTLFNAPGCRERARIYHLNRELGYPLCVIGKRENDEFCRSDFMLAFADDENKRTHRHAYVVDVSQKKIAHLVNEYIDEIIGGFESNPSESLNNENQSLTDQEQILTDGFQAVTKKLENLNLDAKNKDDYIRHVVGFVYGALENRRHKYIMKKGDFKVELEIFIETLRSIGVIRINNQIINFAKETMTYEQAIQKLRDQSK